MKWVHCALFCLFALAGFWLHQRIPFYSAWDMDFTTVNDLYRMTENILPQHINHTGFGMYWPLTWLWNFLPLSAPDLASWINSPVPLVPLAETVVWVRYSSIFVCLILLMSCWSFLRGTTILFALLTLPSLWLFQIQLIRTELWSVMWYGLAFATIPFVKNNKTLLLTFFLAGMGFLTKYQGVFLHLGILLVLIDRMPLSVWPRLPAKKTAKWTLALFIFISLCAALTYIPSSFATFSRSNFPNIFFFAALIVLILPFVNSPWLKWGGLLWYAGLGIMLAFIPHFLMGLKFSASWEYLLFDWRMLFMRHSNPAISAPRADNVLLWSLIHHAALLALWIVCAISQWREFKLLKKSIVVSFFFLIMGSMVIATRGEIKDAIWADVLIIFGLGLFSLKKSKWITAFVILTFFHHSWLIKDLPKTKVFAGQNDLTRYWSEPYESPEVKYTEKMKTLLDQQNEINARWFTSPAQDIHSQ